EAITPLAVDQQLGLKRTSRRAARLGDGCHGRTPFFSSGRMGRPPRRRAGRRLPTSYGEDEALHKVAVGPRQSALITTCRSAQTEPARVARSVLEAVWLGRFRGSSPGCRRRERRCPG